MRSQNGTHWSIRNIAEVGRFNQNAIVGIRRAFGLKPHFQENFRLSTDPSRCVPGEVGQRVAHEIRARLIGKSEGPQYRRSQVTPVERSPHLDDTEQPLQAPVFTGVEATGLGGEAQGAVCGVCGRSRHPLPSRLPPAGTKVAGWVYSPIGVLRPFTVHPYILPGLSQAHPNGQRAAHSRRHEEVCVCRRYLTLDRRASQIPPPHGLDVSSFAPHITHLQCTEPKSINVTNSKSMEYTR